MSTKSPLNTPTNLPPSAITALKPVIKTLKQDLSTLKSEHTSLSSTLTNTLSQIRQSLPLQQVSTDSLETQKHTLEQKTQNLVTLSDDLSDQVDDLRIDITQKRIRPHPRSLSSVKKHLTNVKNQLVSVENVLASVKPRWKKVWQEELQRVIDGQEFLRHQETLVADLRKDLVDTEDVIEHVVKAAELLESRAVSPREWLSGPVGSGGRDAFLGEVKTVASNSEGRVEAIERAERQRQRELEVRNKNELQEELEEVVSVERMRELSLGALRVERERQEKEKKLRQEIWLQRQKQGSREGKDESSATQASPTGSSQPESSLGKPLKTQTMTSQPTTSQSFASQPIPAQSSRAPPSPVQDLSPLSLESDHRSKRVVSDGTETTSTSYDDTVSRSQSHSSGLSRMNRVSTHSLKRFSADISRGPDDREFLERNNYHKIGVLEKDVV